MARCYHSFTYRDLELIFTALMQWNEQIKGTISNEGFSEEVREHKRKFSEELIELIREIRKEMYRRRHYESD